MKRKNENQMIKSGVEEKKETQEKDYTDIKSDNILFFKTQLFIKLYKCIIII